METLFSNGFWLKRCFQMVQDNRIYYPFFSASFLYLEK